MGEPRRAPEPLLVRSPSPRPARLPHLRETSRSTFRVVSLQSLLAQAPPLPPRTQDVGFQCNWNLVGGRGAHPAGPKAGGLTRLCQTALGNFPPGNVV